MLVFVTAVRDSVCKSRYSPNCVSEPMCNRFPRQVRYPVFFTRSLLLYSSFVVVVWTSCAGDVDGIEVRRVMAIVELTRHLLVGARLLQLPGVVGGSVGGCLTVFLSCVVLLL